MTTHSHWDEAFAKSLIADHLHLGGAMLPILHALQDEFGYVDDAAIPLLADALNISKAEVFLSQKTRLSSSSSGNRDRIATP